MEKIENPVLLGLQFFSGALEVLNRFSLLANQHQKGNDTGAQ